MPNSSKAKFHRAPNGVDVQNRVMVALTPEERVDCKARAKAGNMSMSALIRATYLDGLEFQRRLVGPSPQHSA